MYAWNLKRYQLRTPQQELHGEQLPTNSERALRSLTPDEGE